MPEPTTYDGVILIDLDPEPNFPAAYCESMATSGIRDTYLYEDGRLKLTPKTRTTAIKLPIYEDRHSYYCVAKVDSLCNTEERRRAVRALNDFLDLAKKAGRTLKETVREIVQLYPARVLKGFNFEKQNEPSTRLGSSSRFRKVVSCTDTDGNNSQLEQTPDIEMPSRKKSKTAAEDTANRSSGEYSIDLNVPVNNHPLPANHHGQELHHVPVQLNDDLTGVPVSRFLYA